LTFRQYDPPQYAGSGCHVTDSGATHSGLSRPECGEPNPTSPRARSGAKTVELGSRRQTTDGGVRACPDHLDLLTGRASSGGGGS
jgi:hypothetical protein